MLLSKILRIFITLCVYAAFKKLLRALGSDVCVYHILIRLCVMMAFLYLFPDDDVVDVLLFLPIKIIIGRRTWDT